MEASSCLSATLTQIKVKCEAVTVSNKYYVMTADRESGSKAPQTGNLRNRPISRCGQLHAPTRFTSGGRIPENKKGKGLMREMSTWEDNNKMDLKEIGCQDADCVRLALSTAQVEELLRTR
jgi:hypothetical protein